MCMLAVLVLLAVLAVLVLLALLALALTQPRVPVLAVDQWATVTWRPPWLRRAPVARKQGQAMLSEMDGGRRSCGARCVA